MGVYLHIFHKRRFMSFHGPNLVDMNMIWEDEDLDDVEVASR